MGKGTIISGGDGGQYQVQINFNRDRYDAMVAALAAEISAFDAKISDKQTEIEILEAAYRDLQQLSEITQEQLYQKSSEIGKAQSEKSLLELQQKALEKKKETLESGMPDNETVSAWCADLTEDLTGEVGTIEVPGERGIVQIQPGYEGNAAYNGTRDGQILPIIAATTAQAFYNLAMLPGWQKWKPLFRYATIDTINDDGTANISLETAESSQQSLDINQSSSIDNVTIEYMDCNESAFESGDSVLVKFTGQDWDNPVVVGFKDNPKSCLVEYLVIIFTNATQIVWDLASNDYAIIFRTNGNKVNFPCDISDETVASWKEAHTRSGMAVDVNTYSCDDAPTIIDTPKCGYDDSDFPDVSEAAWIGTHTDYNDCSSLVSFTNENGDQVTTDGTSTRFYAETNGCAKDAEPYYSYSYCCQAYGKKPCGLERIDEYSATFPVAFERCDNAIIAKAHHGMDSFLGTWEPSGEQFGLRVSIDATYSKIETAYDPGSTYTAYYIKKDIEAAGTMHFNLWGNESLEDVTQEYFFSIDPYDTCSRDPAIGPFTCYYKSVYKQNNFKTIAMVGKGAKCGLLFFSVSGDMLTDYFSGTVSDAYLAEYDYKIPLFPDTQHSTEYIYDLKIATLLTDNIENSKLSDFVYNDKLGTAIKNTGNISRIFIYK
jgi:hypothetical protein